MRLQLIFLLFLPVIISCSEQEELTYSAYEQESIPAGIAKVSFRNGEQSPQCVYVFRKDGNSFRYDSKIDTGWSAEGELITRLAVGEYKFLFTGPLNGRLDVLPASLNHSVTIEQLRFVSQTDPTDAEGILPAEELFLPEPQIADSVYSIRGGDKISCSLRRRVAQLDFILKRGFKEGDTYIPLPYKDSHNILEMVKELRVEISGVARECNYSHTSGAGNVFCSYDASTPNNIDTQGFATFNGPFVFPPNDGKEVRLTLSLISWSGHTFQPLQLVSKLEANRKLQVNLWLNSSSFDIGVVIHNLPISERTEGDSGVWE